MTNSLLIQATSTKPLIETASHKTQAGSPKSDISESKKQKTFKIKSFGNDTECEDVAEVKATLLSQYNNYSVSIVKVSGGWF